MSADAASSQSVTPGKSDLNTKIENRASEFLHDTINARDLLDSGILCGATEEEILLVEESEKKNHSVNETTSVAVPAPLAVVEMPQVVSGSQPVQKEKKYQCATCYKKFPDMSSLKRHVPTHKKDLHPYVCGRCQKRYKSEDELNTHMKTHVQEKPYRCSVCSREFSVAQILKRHMLIHSGERAHECEYCGKRFTTKADVTRHVRIHTGEKPHKCPYCESRFVQAGQLKRHLVTHEKYQEQLRDGTLPEKPARKKTKPHKCTICKAEFFHARQLQSHINFAHDNGGSDGASGSPQISPESRPVVGQNNLHSMEYTSADALQGEGEWKTYAPDPGTTDAGLSTVVLGQPNFPEEATPTIEWTDAPNPLTPQEMADLKPFIRISGHDDYAYSTPPPTDKGNPAEEQPNVQQPVSASVAPQFVEANQLVQVDQSNVIGTTPDGKTVIMDFIPTVVGETVSTTAITQPYVAVEATTYSQDQTATKVNGDYIHVNDGTIMNVAPANGYYSANVVKSEVTEEVPGAQQGDLMELTAVKLGDIQNGVQPDGNVAANVENHAGYIPISQSQEKTGFKFEWEMPIDKHSMPEASSTCMPIPPADVNQCIPLPTADSSGSIYLPVVPAESINKNYVPVTPEEINKQFGTMSTMPAPISEPINYSTNQENASVNQPQVQTVSEVQQPTADPVTVPAPTPEQQQQSAQQQQPPPQQPQQQQQLTNPTPILAPDAAAQAALPPMPVPTLPQQVMPQQSLPVDATASEQAVQKDEQKPVSMLEELMLVLNEAPQNTEADAPSPAVTEATSQVKKEPGQEVKGEGVSTSVKRENSAEYQTIDKNCDIFSGEISSVENAPKAESTSSGELKIKIKIEAPLKGFVCKPKNTPKREKRQTPKKNIHQYVCKTCGDKFTTLGTLQKHVLNHTKVQHKAEKPCCVAVCDNQFVKDKCEPQHERVVAKLRKAKEDEKTAVEDAAPFEADTQAEPMTEGEDDVEMPGNTLAGNEEFAGAHQCALCGKSFTNPVILKAHMLLHSGKKPHKCPVCGKKFGTEAYMKGHLLIHTGEAPHKCDYCGKVFSMKGDLNRHVRSHTGEKPHKCEICGKNFTQSGDKKRHMLLQHEGKLPFTCYICEMGFPTKIQFSQHKKTHKSSDAAAAERPPRRQSRRLSGEHKKTDEQAAENSSGENSPYKCAQCYKSFSHPRHLINHMRVHPAKNNNKCVDCGETFPSNDVLKTHIMENHEQSLEYKCSVCNTDFSELDQLEAHRKIHTGEAPYKCGQCNKTFCHVDNLNKHVASHTTEKLYKCKLCDEHFTLRLYLNKHLKTCHTEQKLFMCLACDKEFAEIAPLKRHIVTHKHDKAHKCKLCNKAFKSRSGLNFHMLSHKNKHECTICGKQFSLDIMLKNHMATHNDGDSAYACAEDGCDAVFVTQEQLSRHQHTTHDAAKSQKPSVYDEDTEIETEEEEMNQSESASFTCAKCNATFSEFDHLKEHLEMHEEIEENCQASKLDEGPSADSAQDETVDNNADIVPSINNTETSEGTSIPVGES